ncbi:MAG: hypothetical protein KatS3mg058_0030 [Roseiflexus sp.]|nr:MAG: hypothetical protein KatS3mg058_0030 [Roseiflexus sp.]
MAVFSFPGERFDESVPASWLNGWERWLQEQVEAIAQDIDLETPPHARLSGPTRSLVPMVREWREAKKRVAIPMNNQWDVRWLVPSQARGHVCPVCGVRLNGDPTNKGKPCAVCRERHHHRRDAWLQGQLDNDTIWFEEVADRNGRLALLTFSLDLEEWLSGERVDSLRAQAIPEWVNFNRKVFRSIENQTSQWKTSHLQYRLIHYLEKRIQNPPKSIATDGILSKLIPDLEEEFADPSSQSGSWQRIFARLVEDRASPPPQWSGYNTENARWFVFQFFRKLPSPGRVYRFWREAEEFFRDLLREFRQLAARSDNPWRVRRLVLIPDNQQSWRDLTLYDGRWQGRQMSLVYVQSLNVFITATNLACLLRPEESSTALKDAQITLEDEDAPGQSRNIKVQELKQPHAHLSVYHPLIPVEISPLRFRVLVPLEVASECVDRAVAWWQERFARVWDRLPLRVGVIAFPRMTPYQAVVEATRNVEDDLAGKEETWQVQEAYRQSGVVALRLHRWDGRETSRVVPVTLPDGREDVFYPYVAVEDQQVRFCRDFQHPNGQVYRHVADLRLGDGIKVFPTQVKTLFMDSTAARFDTNPSRSLDDWKQMRDVWALLQRVAPSQTALQRLRSELARLEKDWQSPAGGLDASPDLWQDTLRSLLVHHLAVQGADLATLTGAATQGILQWAIDWHITVLKESV